MEIRKTKGVVVLGLTSADLSRPAETYRAVEILVKDQGETQLVADLSRVPRLVSLQAGALFALHALCYENVAVLKLAGATPKVKMVLRLIGLDKVMEVHHGAEVALESFGPPGAQVDS